MALVNDEDVQIHLPVDIAKVEAVPDDRNIAFEDAERIIRGYLAGVFEPVTLAAWIDPDSTPPEIRAVAGRFAAAKIYRLRFGGASMTDPEYAQNLYNEAMLMLNDIREGKVELTGVDDTSTGFSSEFFEPNNTTIDPFFTMGAQF